MRNAVALVLLSVFSFQLYAQQPRGSGRAGGQQPAGRFYGKVVDAANKGIDAATVTLVRKQMDSATQQSKETVAGGMLTASNGEFSIENVPAFGRYTLRVTGIGYKTSEQAVAFERPGENGATGGFAAFDKDLGNIKLTIDDKLLSNVTVTSTKPLLQLGIDRKIFNVDKNIVSAGGSAVDVMKNVPSVNVDIDGNVTLRNNAPTIFVDGRPTNLTLEQIPADAIESVEIITNPSAKFDASGGTAGILNIVLKKNKRVGYSGNVRTNVDSRGRFGFGGDVNVRQNKINVFASGNFNQRKSISTGNTDRIVYGVDTTHTFQNDRNNMTGLFGFGRAGFDYFIDNRNTITVSGSMARGKMMPHNTNERFIDSSAFGYFYPYEFDQINSNAQNKFRNFGTQLSYKHNFPKAGREWTADVTLNQGQNENKNLIQTDFYDLPGKTFNRTYLQTQSGSSDNKNLVIQTDYANPINDKTKFEIGARASVRTINSQTDYTLLNKNSSIRYNNEDRVFAAYSTFSNRIGNFGYQLGLRAESSNNEGVLNEKQTFKKTFPISFFPSVFISQKLTDLADLQLNYSRRINRPNFWQLFPFTDYTDSLNISRGNPDLNPEFTNSLELSFSQTFENRDNLIASIYFKNTNDLITRVLNPEFDTILGKSVFINSYTNANRSYVTGLELIGRNKLTKWWEMVTNLNFFTSRIDLDSLPDPDQFLSYFFKINNTFRLPNNFSIQLSGDYQSRVISSPGGTGGGGGGRGGGGGQFGGGGGSAAQGFIRPNYGVDAAVRYEFLKNRAASLSLNINDIFRTRKYDAHTESQYILQDVVRRRDPQVVRLNFNWRFGKMDASLFKRKNNRTEDAGVETNF
ncbi:MAG TPA: outer membrane beta-barrel protein [Chitinophagaceae bacterium]|nr:outer membrane beta-barrel protein [Chitinophagaceae bacterium]